MAIPIKQLPPPERPRECLLRAGRAALSDTELVALIFGGGLECASRVITSSGGAAGIARSEIAELCALPGVGPTRAGRLLAAVELGRRAFHGAPDSGDLVRGPDQVWRVVSDLVHLDQEELHALALDARHRVTARHLVARGAVNVVHVSPRDLFRRLLRSGATAAIVAHNHPSGDPTPSRDDIELTRRLRAAGELIGIPLLDHVVVATGGFYAFSDERLRSEPSGQPAAGASEAPATAGGSGRSGAPSE